MKIEIRLQFWLKDLQMWLDVYMCIPYIDISAWMFSSQMLKHHMRKPHRTWKSEICHQLPLKKSSRSRCARKTFTPRLNDTGDFMFSLVFGTFFPQESDHFNNLKCGTKNEKHINGGVPGFCGIPREKAKLRSRWSFEGWIVVVVVVAVAVAVAVVAAAVVVGWLVVC